MIRRSKEEWLGLFAQQAASGVSAQKFCKANGLCSKHFSMRKKQLGLRGSRHEKAFVRVVPTKPVVPVAASTSGTEWVVRYERATLTFEALPTAAWLAQLLRALA
jgi:hypothetical protein